jgi:hypothetical protein
LHYVRHGPASSTGRMPVSVWRDMGVPTIRCLQS